MWSCTVRRIAAAALVIAAPCVLVVIVKLLVGALAGQECVAMMDEGVLQHRNRVSRVVCKDHHHIAISNTVSLLGPWLRICIVWFVVSIVWAHCDANLEPVIFRNRCHNALAVLNVECVAWQAHLHMQIAEQLFKHQECAF